MNWELTATGTQGERDLLVVRDSPGEERQEVINISCTCFKYDMTCNNAVLVVYDRGIFTVPWNGIKCSWLFDRTQSMEGGW